MVEAGWTSPRSAQKSWSRSSFTSLVLAVVMSFFISLMAPSFPRLVKTLTVSQPVKECNQIRTSQMLSPNELANFPKCGFCCTLLIERAGDVSVEHKTEHHDICVFGCHFDCL